jgi:hypothetical protein
MEVAGQWLAIIRRPKRMFPNQFNNLERKSARQIRVQRSVQ